MKRLFIIISISSLLVLGGYSIYEYTSYTLKNSERNITSFIHEHLGPKQKEPLLLEVFPIEGTNKVVATFEYSQSKLGVAIFIKGVYGKLKLETFLLDRSYYSEVMNTRDGTQILFIGENLQTSVKTIETDIVIQGERVKLAIPPQKYFTHISKMENALKIDKEPIYIYRNLKGALAGATKELGGMEVMFVDENNQSFLIYSEKNAVLKTVLGGFQQSEEGFIVTGVEEPNYYTMNEEKSFCYEEKKIDVHHIEQTYLHGLVPQEDEVQKVVLEVKRKDEVIYQFSSNVVANQFLIHISRPEILESDENTIKNFIFMIRTEITYELR